jgi:pterin-4a-carbinolamine dehydratase
MRSMKQLIESTLNSRAKGVTVPSSRGPIVARAADVPPLMPAQRWVIRNNGETKELVKKYMFRDLVHRNRFVADVLEHEIETQHAPTVSVESSSVCIRLMTAGIEDVTERDREFAKFADVLYRDIVHSLDNFRT